MRPRSPPCSRPPPTLDDEDHRHAGRKTAVAENDYDGVILSLVKKYCPPGLLGLALTALLASFMSGMAGNVTAFNTVWTYDLYQAYIAKDKSDAHYIWMGRAITVVGILLSIACAYFARMYSNAMDIIQLVFGFVNAPLFATFLLGMFWARTTATGAFFGLFGGIGVSAVFHGLTVAEGKGGWLGRSFYEFPVQHGAELLAGRLRLHRLLPPDHRSSPWPASAPRPTPNSRAWCTRSPRKSWTKPNRSSPARRCSARSCSSSASS